MSDSFGSISPIIPAKSSWTPCLNREEVTRHPLAVALYIIAMAAVIVMLAIDVLALPEKLILGCSVAGAHVVVAIPYYCYKALNKAKDKELQDGKINISFAVSETSSSMVLAEDVPMNNLDNLIQKLLRLNHTILTFGEAEAVANVPEQHQVPVLTRSATSKAYHIKIYDSQDKTIKYIELQIHMTTQVVTMRLIERNATTAAYDQLNASTAGDQKTFYVTHESNGHYLFLSTIFTGENKRYSLACSPLEQMLNEWKGAAELSVGTINNPSELTENSPTLVRCGQSCFVKMMKDGEIGFMSLQACQCSIKVSEWKKVGGSYQPAVHYSPISLQHPNNETSKQIASIFKGTHAIKLVTTKGSS